MNMDKVNITPVYTLNAIKKYYEKNKDRIKEERKMKLEKMKEDEEFMRKRREYHKNYARLFRQKKKAEKMAEILLAIPQN